MIPAEDSHVLRVFMNQPLPRIVKAEGVWLEDDTGRRYLDSCGGRIVCNLGHGMSEMAQVMKDQAEKVAYAYRAFFTTTALENAAAKVSRFSGGAADKIFFVSGGSEAIEISVKLARQYHLANGDTGKYKVISRWMSYHGGTMGALSLTGLTSQRQDYLPYLNDSCHIAPAYCYRCWFGQKPESCDLACAEALDKEIQNQGPASVSAFLAEPLTGASLAAATPRTDYFTRVREICDRYGVLLIMDEVMTGFGRTGRNFAFEHFDTKPDIMALGKGIGGGYFPVGATALSKKVADLLAEKSGVFTPGFSWAANPLAAAVVDKTMDLLVEGNLVARAEEMGAYLADRLEDLREHPSLGDIRGRGLMRGLEFVRDKKTRQAIDPALGFNQILGREAMERGLFLLYLGPHPGFDLIGDMALLGPPFVITKAEVDQMVDMLDSSLTAAEKQAGF